MQKKSSRTWRLVAAIGILSVAVLGTGFVVAVVGPSGDAPTAQPTTTQPAPNNAQHDQKQTSGATGTLNIVALGDSLTAGVGDASGKGYVGDLKDLLVKTGRQVSVQNLGISGLMSPELVQSVQSPGIQSTIKGAGLVLISIGANDLTHSIGDVQQLIATDQIDEKKIIQTEGVYTKNMQTILQTVRANNPTAPVLVIGLYNPFEGAVEDKNGVIDRELNMWNTNVMKITQQFQNVKVVPTFDIFQWNTGHLLSSDHFHPNQQGYDLMATRIVQALPPGVQPKQP